MSNSQNQVDSENFDNEGFRVMITKALGRAKLGPHNIEKLTTPKCMKRFKHAFTHKSISASHNYEILEFYGDAILKYAQSRYLTERFPKINSEDIFTRTRSKLENTKTLGIISQRLGFTKFIIASDQWKATNAKLWEDIFEAFIGVFAQLIDEVTKHHVSFAVIYVFVKSLLDEIEISVDLVDIKDPKSRLKEFYNKKYKVDNPDFEYVDTGEGNRNFRVQIHHRETGKLMADATASPQLNAEKKASQQALNYFQRLGEYTPPQRAVEKSAIVKLEDAYHRLGWGLPVYKQQGYWNPKKPFYNLVVHGGGSCQNKVLGRGKNSVEERARKYAAETAYALLIKEKYVWVL